MSISITVPRDTKTTNIGTLQGSVTAPWLFSPYIYDMNRVSTKFKFVHYMKGDNLVIL